MFTLRSGISGYIISSFSGAGVIYFVYTDLNCSFSMFALAAGSTAAIPCAFSTAIIIRRFRFPIFQEGLQSFAVIGQFETHCVANIIPICFLARIPCF